MINEEIIDEKGGRKWNEFVVIYKRKVVFSKEVLHRLYANKNVKEEKTR